MLADSAFGTNDRDALFDAVDDRQEEAGVDDLTEMHVEPDLIREHVPFAPGPASASEMVRKVTSFQKKSMKAYFAAGQYTDLPSDHVRVGTIHSAKGREADHVYVGTDLTEKVVEQMAATVEDPTDVPGCEEFTRTTSPVPTLTDNERRVYYVGMSRARERLVLMENLVGGAPTLPVDVLLHDEPVDETVEDLLDDAEEPEDEEAVEAA
jgi:DNA helicase-2/ATP-dependent DNA helicase PcrA